MTIPGLQPATNSAMAAIQLHTACSTLLNLPAAVPERAEILQQLQGLLGGMGITAERSPLPAAITDQLTVFRTNASAPLDQKLIQALGQLRTRLETIPGFGLLLTQPLGPVSLLTEVVAGRLSEDNTGDTAATAMTWGPQHATNPDAMKETTHRYAMRLEILTHLLQETGHSRESALLVASTVLGRELIQIAHEWRHEACIDALTAVMTRKAGMRLVRQAIDVSTVSATSQTSRKETPNHVVIMVDIDHFKRINDAYEHQVGDIVLKEFAETLHRAVGRPDDIVFRYGGEEFLILLRHTDLAGAISVITRLQKEIRDLEFKSGEKKFGITASFGYATLQNGVRSADDAESRLREAIGRADTALYAAKHAGRDRAIVWSEEMGETSPKK